MKVLVGDGARSGRELLLRRVAGLISSRLVEVGESVAEPVAEVRGAPVLLLEDWVFDNGGPNGAMLIVTGFEGTVLLLGKRATLLAACLLEDGGSIWQGGADFGRKVSLGVWIVLFIRVREVSAEARG
jgi:hypothetical protein